MQGSKNGTSGLVEIVEAVRTGEQWKAAMIEKNWNPTLSASLGLCFGTAQHFAPNSHEPSQLKRLAHDAKRTKIS